MPDMAKTYDEQARHFAKFAPSSFTFVQVERPAYERHVRMHCWPPTKALDIGSGAGRMASYLTSRGVKPENITGIEISPNLVEIARQEVPGATFICGDARDGIPYPDNTFDLVTSHMVLEFLDDEGLKKVLSEVHRILKPHAFFCAITTHPNKMTKSDGVDKRGWFDTSAPWGKDDIIQNWYRTKEDFGIAVAESGLQLRVIEDLRTPPEAEKADPERYAHYSALDPIRLLLKAVK